jgi:hypothetical protein
MAQSIKKQLESKKYKETELHKSAGILDDHSIRKTTATREAEIQDLNKSGNTLTIHGDVDLGSKKILFDDGYNTFSYGTDTFNGFHMITEVDGFFYWNIGTKGFVLGDGFFAPDAVSNNYFDLGGNGYAWKDLYLKGVAHLDGGSIKSSTGAISFDNENLTTTGTIESGSIGTNLKAAILNFLYPVGVIYTSIVSTSPATLFGGTWSAFATGRMLVGINASDTAIDTVEETGGMLDHVHYYTGSFSGWGGLTAGNKIADVTPAGTYSNGFSFGGGYGGYTAEQTDAAGHTAGLDLRPPYIVVYMWKRTA